MEKINIAYETRLNLGIKNTGGNPCYKVTETVVAVPSIEDDAYFLGEILGYTAVIYAVNLSNMTIARIDSCHVGVSTRWKWKYSSIEKWCEELFLIC